MLDLTKNVSIEVVISKISNEENIDFIPVGRAFKMLKADI